MYPYHVRGLHPPSTPVIILGRLRSVGGKPPVEAGATPTCDRQRTAWEGHHLWTGGCRQWVPGGGPHDRMGPPRWRGTSLASGRRGGRSDFLAR